MSYDFEPAPPYKPNPPQRGPHYQAVVDNALRWLADNQPTPDGIRSVLHDYPALCKILYRDGRDILGFNDAHKILTEVAAGRLNPAAVKEAADRERERADLRTIAERIKADAATANKTKTKQRQAVTQSEAAQLCNVTEKTIRRWEKGEATPEGYPGRGDAVTLRAWAARRKEAATVKRALKNTVHVDCQKLSESDRWQADMKRRGATGYRSSDY
jgi:DNA-binding transcriptional regulator YiaG